MDTPEGGPNQEPAFISLEDELRAQLNQVETERDNLQSRLSEVEIENIALRAENHDLIIQGFDVSRESSRYERLAGLANVDHLTKLLNRRGLELVMAEFLQTGVRRRKKDVDCILFGDLDFFKDINDTLGHGQGDLLLQATADIFKERLRTSDIASRYGGDEFVIVLRNTSLEDAVQAAEMLRHQVHSIDTFRRPSGEIIKPSITFGVCEIDPYASPAVVCEQADALMVMGKSKGLRNQVWWEEKARVGLSGQK